MYKNPQIYDKLNCIFVHVPKTAGTSIEKCLRDINDKNQIVGGHSTSDSLLKFKKRDFSNYFTFTIVRNPWDRLLSAYLYMHKMDTCSILGNKPIKEHKTFESFVMNYCTEKVIHENMHLKPQYIFLCIKDKIAVDYWGKYEHLNDEWSLICRKLKVNINLPWLNKSNESNEYTSHYTEEMRKKVEKLYIKDIILFNYQFI